MIDIGSTFTKACAIDLEAEELLASAMSPSTVQADICNGIDEVISALDKAIDKKVDFRLRLASSSAAGGLRMIVVGLVPELTSEAGRLSALGAGAKVISTYSYRVNEKEREKIEEQDPDIILLVGGTDGGEEETILWNARTLSQLKSDSPIIVAGNKVVVHEAKDILTSHGKNVHVTENVLPEIGRLNIEPAREMIRHVFIDRIVKSKGFEGAGKYVDEILMPTPTAVFEAVKLLADGTGTLRGLGELVALDIGGATTDVYSIARGLPSGEGTILKGLRPPCSMRTVEGDLGIRYNAASLVEEAGEENVLENIGIKDIDLNAIVKNLSKKITKTPENERERTIDVGLARSAAQLAVKRHAGHIEIAYTPMGSMNVQYGKDLRGIKHLIATGGIIAHSSDKGRVKILEGALYNKNEQFSLRPESPLFYGDNRYITFAAGLLSKYYPEQALRILIKYLARIDR